jgi:tRNA G46 methylase TrmB
MSASWPSRPLSGPFVTNELDHAGSEHLDPSYVARYDTKQKYDPAPDVAALRGRGLDGRSTIIDMGCGTGVFTLAIAPHCRRVIAVDVSQPMLDRLSAATKDREIDNVEFVRTGFLTYEHQGDPVDYAFTRNGLFTIEGVVPVEVLGASVTG